MNVFGVLRILVPCLNVVELYDLRKSNDCVKRRAQLVRHVGKELGFCEIGCLCRPHRFLGTLGSSVSFLLRGEQRQSGILSFEQGSEPRAVVLKEGFGSFPLSYNHCVYRLMTWYISPKPRRIG